jgi:hypothetical protein
VDGNFDCTVRRDKGAYELQGQSNTAPSASISAPDSALAGSPVTFSGTGTDAEDSALGFAWGFSDGGSAGGPSADHAFPAGDQSATLTVSDSHGCTGTATHPLAVAALAVNPLPADLPPAFSTVSVSPRVFAPVGARATAARRVPRGTKFRYTLSESARVTIAIQRALPGRRVGKRCLAPTARRRSRPRCTRYLIKATLIVANAKAGANSTAFSGRARGRPLAPGRYRGVLSARDAAGNAATNRTVTFRIVRP